VGHWPMRAKCVHVRSLRVAIGRGHNTDPPHSDGALHVIKQTRATPVAKRLPEKDAQARRSFDVLGISEHEEAAYRWLLANPRSSAYELARGMSVTRRRSVQILEDIERKGLTTHTPEQPRRYLPAPPDMALQGLILQRQKDLQSAQVSATELQEQVSLLRVAEQEQVVELITNHEAEAQAFQHMHRSAKEEVLTLIRLPGRVSTLNPAPDEAGRTQREAAARGVRFRSIVDADFLAAPGGLRRIKADMQAGEDIRVTGSLPFKLLVTDRRIAILPLNLEKPDSPVLLLRSSTLLDALCALFEMLWDRAAQINLSADGRAEVAELPNGWAADAAELVPLLAAGLNDKAIAHELGVSLRTFNRRIASVAAGLDARTRFQAGWLAALRLSAKR
jgi:sugar-specific transcriptional regulator TrmB